MFCTIGSVGEDKCTGCGACMNVCITSAITMEYINHFLYPVIDVSKCVQCGACGNVCPELNYKANDICKENSQQECFVVMADDITRKKSSSGGVFSLLAEYFLKKHGCVSGASWDEELNVKHILIDSEDRLELLRRSKYVQSDMEYTYRKIRQLLDKGEYVLFSGCPCQCSGLKAYLKNDCERLLTVDLICSGAPSPLLFKDYIEDITGKQSIKEVNFRSKSKGWGSDISVRCNNGFEYYSNSEKDPWYLAFNNGISTRPGCSKCKYTSMNRIGDITVGDFWGASEIDPSYDDGKGTSIVLLNTEKGKRMFEKIRKKLSLCVDILPEELLKICSKRNGRLIHPKAQHPNRSRFYDLLSSSGFSASLNETLRTHYDVGIVGWWYNDNYGGTLTYFALHQVLKSMGLSVLMIDKTLPENGECSFNKDSIPRRFAKKHYNISNMYPANKMGELNALCDSFISGSDQLFNPWLWEYSGPTLFLDFVNPNKNFISYASSFGDESFRCNEALKVRMGYYLRRFSALSVREDYAVNIAREHFGLEAEHVLDPVFVCDESEYYKLAESSSADTGKKYFTSFFLDPNAKKGECVLKLGKKLGLEYINLINAIDFEKNSSALGLDNVKSNADIEDFLKYYRDSEFIVTDSFHGTCFAIIFRKNFISVANKSRGIGRVESLLRTLGLSDRMVCSTDEIFKREDLFEDIAYDRVESILRSKRYLSYSWLKDNLLKPKSRADNAFNVLDIKQYDTLMKFFHLQSIVARQQQEIDELKNIIKRIGADKNV